MYNIRIECQSILKIKGLPRIMSSFFRYPGGKEKLSNVIVSKLVSIIRSNDPLSGQIHPIEYREPFFGGGSIGIKFLSKYKNIIPISSVWINDKDIGIASIWDSVINHTQELNTLIQDFFPTPDTFYSFKEELLKENSVISVDLAFKKIVIHQISYSGLGTRSGGPIGGKLQQSKYTVDCRWSPKHIIKKTNILQNLFSNFNNLCTSIDYSDLITKEVNDKTHSVLIYLDPPYFDKGGQLYQFSFSEQDHINLSLLLKNTNHSWVLSYDDCPEIRDLYQWANIQQTESVNYSITNSRLKQELIISNK